MYVYTHVEYFTLIRSTLNLSPNCFGMTKEQLETFFNERPSLSRTGVCKEADISKGLLDLIFKDQRKITKKTIKKLLPVLKKYGWAPKKAPRRQTRTKQGSSGPGASGSGYA